MVRNIQWSKDQALFITWLCLLVRFLVALFQRRFLLECLLLETKSLLVGAVTDSSRLRQLLLHLVNVQTGIYGLVCRCGTLGIGVSFFGNLSLPFIIGCYSIDRGWGSRRLFVSKSWCKTTQNWKRCHVMDSHSLRFAKWSIDRSVKEI